MTTTTKIIWFFLLAAACALALALFPRAAGGTGSRAGAYASERFPTVGVSCVLGEVSLLHGTLRFERAAPTQVDSCAVRLS